MTVTKEMIEAVTAELLAHGEFGSTAERNRLNAEVAAKAVLALLRSAEAGKPVVKAWEGAETQEYTLRAMALNYSNGHSWDHLDGECAMKAADEIRALRSALSTPADIEPVAWRYKIKGEYGWSDWVVVQEVAFLEEYKRDKPSSIVIEALYAAPVAVREPVSVPEVNIDDLAYRFWSVHPNELDEWVKTAPKMPEWYNGGIRAWFFACEMRKLLAAAPQPNPIKVDAGGRKFKHGDRVTKTKGSSWTGRIVGFYSTNLTPIGYAVESETETGSVQIYPESVLAAQGDRT